MNSIFVLMNAAFIGCIACMSIMFWGFYTGIKRMSDESYWYGAISIAIVAMIIYHII